MSSPPRFPTFARWWADPRTRTLLRVARVGGRATTRAIVRTLTFGPVLGAIYVTAITSLSLPGPVVNDAEHILGSARETIVALVWARYTEDLERAVTVLVVLAAVSGALLGAVAGGLVALAARWEERTPSRLERAAWTLAAIVVLHAGGFAWSMSRNPQLYEETWNAAGGIRHAIQSLVAMRLAPSSVIVLALLAVGATVGGPVLARFALRRGSSARRARGSEAGLVALGVVALAISVAAFALPHPRTSTAHPRTSRALAPTREHPNVILLAADSLRDDRVDPVRMPNVTRLARAGTRFTRAVISFPRTLPSWTAILTGQWSHHSGIRTTFPPYAARARDLDTMVSRFAAAGYATRVESDFVGDLFQSMRYGFQETATAPLQTFREYVRQGVVRRATPLMAILQTPLGHALVPSMREYPSCGDAGYLASDLVGAIGEEKAAPFFLVGFFGATHIPYAAPSPYFKRFTDPAYEGRTKYGKVVWDPRVPQSDAEIRQVRALYDGAVASVDDAIGRVLDAVDRAGIADRTIVVVLADHGEALYEGGRLGHGPYVVGDETMRIPLVIFDPRTPGGKSVNELVRDVDLAPTLCELAGVTPPAALDGESFAGALRGEALAPRLGYGETDLWFNEGIPDVRIPYPAVATTVITDTRHEDTFVLRPELEALVGFAKHRMVTDGHWKLVYAPTTEGPRYFLFDTSADPAETIDVQRDHPAEVARLREALWAWMLQDRAMEERHGFLAPRGIHVAYVDGDGAKF